MDVSKRANFEIVKTHPWFSLHNVVWAVDGDGCDSAPCTNVSCTKRSCSPWYGGVGDVFASAVSDISESMNVPAQPHHRKPWAGFDHHAEAQERDHKDRNAEESSAAVLHHQDINDNEEEEEEFGGGWYYGSY